MNCFVTMAAKELTFIYFRFDRFKRFCSRLQGICFLREAPERANGTDRRAGKWGLVTVPILLIVAPLRVTLPVAAVPLLRLLMVKLPVPVTPPDKATAAVVPLPKVRTFRLALFKVIPPDMTNPDPVPFAAMIDVPVVLALIWTTLALLMPV